MGKAFRFPAAVLGASGSLLFAAGCGSPGPGKAAEKPAAAARDEAVPAPDPKAPHPLVLARFCKHPEAAERTFIVVLKDSAGNIGGYAHGVRLMDTPIFYLDKDGKDYAMFHIFGRDEEKAGNGPRIDSLRKAYPLEEPLRCP